MAKTALGDLRVLDLAGPEGLYCTKQLAELGADVIKVERPGGDPARHIGPFVNNEPDPEKSIFFFHFNTSKRGITLNLESEPGKDIFRQLVKKADVVVETFPTGYLAKLGLDYDALAKVKPDLIMTSITGFGQTGPRSGYKSSDIVGSASGGFMWISGFKEDPPNCVGGYQSFHLVGVNAAIGTLLAVARRDVSGKGSHVDVSMQESVVTATEHSIPAYAARGTIRQRTGRHVYRGWNEVYPCKDGYIMCSPFGGGSWKKVLEWATSEGMAADLNTEKYLNLLSLMSNVQMDRQTVGPKADTDTLEKSDAEIAHVETVWENFLKMHTRQELYEKCQGLGVALMPVYNASDQLKDPQLLARKWFMPVEHPELGRTLTYAGPPYRLSETPWRITRRCPMIGEHNTEIYQGELGLSAADVSRLKSKGVI